MVYVASSRSRHPRGNLVLVTGLMIGLASLALGARALVDLTASFQTGDLLYDDGPELFSVWLDRHARSGTIDPEAIGRRLLAMPIASRRATADAMMQPGYLTAAAGGEGARGIFLNTLELGLTEALSKAPTSGDLWLAASKIRTMHRGFDTKAETYLSMSYLVAPREATVARSRLVFASSVSPLMRDGFADEQDRDLQTVTAIYPGFAAQYRDWLNSRKEGRTAGKR